MRLLACIVLSAAVSAAAAEKKLKVVAVDAQPAVVKAISASIGKKYKVVTVPRPLSDQPTTKDIRAACAPSGAVGVVLVKVVLGGFGVQVLSAYDGTPLDAFTFNGPPKKKPLKTLPKPVEKQLLDALKEAKAAPAETPEAAPVVASPAPVTTPAPAPAPVAAAPKPAPPSAPAPAAPAEPPPAESPSAQLNEKDEPSAPPGTPSELPALRLGVGFRGFNRTLTWTGSPSEALAAYSVPFAPSVAFDGTWFPAAAFTNGFVSNLGVAVQGDFGVGLSSRVDTVRFATRADRLRLGATLRVPLTTRFELDAVVGYQRQSFSVAATSPDGFTRPNIPSVVFNGARAAIGARFSRLGPVTIDALGGFTLTTSAGELASTAFFPRASAFAVDASAGVSVAFAEHLELRLAADWNRYFITLRPDEGATLFARGAADQSLGGSLAVTWVM